MLLLNIPITTAVGPLTTAPFHTRGVAPPSSVVLQANFSYGSDGETVDCDVETSLDFGTTWIGVANFNFATESARVLYNLSSLTPVTDYTPTALDPNTCVDGIIRPSLALQVFDHRALRRRHHLAHRRLHRDPLRPGLMKW